MRQTLPARRLLALSPEMTLAIKSVLALSAEEGQPAKMNELAQALGASEEKLREVLDRLCRAGIVRNHAPDAQTVSLSAPLETLTLADIAEATGQWVVSASCKDDRDASSPGLSRALCLVREGVLDGLAKMRVASYADATA